MTCYLLTSEQVDAAHTAGEGASCLLCPAPYLDAAPALVFAGGHAGLYAIDSRLQASEYDALKAWLAAEGIAPVELDAACLIDPDAPVEELP